MRNSGPASVIMGVGLKIGATFWMAATVAAIKLLAGGVPLGQIVFARSVLTLPLLLLFLSYRRSLRRAMTTSGLLGHVIRGLIGGLGMLTWFSAVQRLPLSDAQAIAFTGPLFGVVLAVILLREKVQIYRWTAVFVGFIGVTFILSEPLLVGSVSDRDLVGVVLALLFAGLSALASIQVRRMTASESPTTIVVYFSVVTSCFGLASLPWGWIWPDIHQFALLIFIGLAGGASQLMLTHALRYSEASFLAPFEYISMLWVVIFGIVLFDESPSAMVLAGSAIVIASGTFVMLRERWLRKHR